MLFVQGNGGVYRISMRAIIRTRPTSGAPIKVLIVTDGVQTKELGDPTQFCHENNISWHEFQEYARNNQLEYAQTALARFIAKQLKIKLKDLI